MCVERVLPSVWAESCHSDLTTDNTGEMTGINVENLSKTRLKYRARQAINNTGITGGSICNDNRLSK